MSIPAEEATEMGLVEVADAIAAGRLTALEVAQACLVRIERLQPRLNCFIALDKQSALERARRADAALAEGKAPGALHGVPLAHKDLYYRAGRVSTGGTLIRKDFVPRHTATVLERLDAAALASLVETFHRRHQEAYGYAVPGEPVEVVHLRLVVTRKRPAPPPEPMPAGGEPPRDALLEERPVWFAGQGYGATPVYDRARLRAGAAFAGPAIVEQMDATTVIPPGAQARLDGAGNILIALEGAVGSAEEGAWAAASTR